MGLKHFALEDKGGNCRKSSVMNVLKQTLFLVLTSQQMQLLVMPASIVQTQGNKKMTAASH